MKDGRVSKEHCSNKIYALLLKSSAYPPFYRQPPYMDYPQPYFYKKILRPPFNNGDVHTMQCQIIRGISTN